MSSPGLQTSAWVVALASASSAQITARVSVTSTGSQAQHGGSGGSMSADGRFVVFHSVGNNLVPGDTNGFWDVFVRDRDLGVTERVSVDSGGAQGNGHSEYPSISADARYVAFDSDATNLVAGDTNNQADIFVHDRQLGTTERVSLSSSEAQANSWSASPSISADGRCVAFGSWASNLVPGDVVNTSDLFVRDRQLGTTEMVNLDLAGQPASGAGLYCRISGDGRFVAFASGESDIVPGDANGQNDVFVRDRQSDTTERVSVDGAGAEANGGSGGSFISADGRYVGFFSWASNLVPGDTNANPDSFLRDRQLGTTERVSVDSAGGESNFGGVSPTSISADGRYVLYGSPATNLVPGDTNGAPDIFVRDRVNGTTTRVNVSSSGAQTSNDSFPGALSADGRYVMFASRGNNLVPVDTNLSQDVFVHDQFGGTDFTSTCDPGVGGVIACPCANPPSGPGRGCNNSASTGGAVLSASGGAILSSDSLVFTTSGEKPTSLSVVRQWVGSNPTGVVFGQGVRCTSGTVKRMYTKSAVGGSITAPDFGAGDPQVSVRSAAVGDTIVPGQSRWYFVYYRDGVVLGGCPPVATFNTTQTGKVAWVP